MFNSIGCIDFLLCALFLCAKVIFVKKSIVRKQIEANSKIIQIEQKSPCFFINSSSLVVVVMVEDPSIII